MKKLKAHRSLWIVGKTNNQYYDAMDWWLDYIDRAYPVHISEDAKTEGLTLASNNGRWN